MLNRTPPPKSQKNVDSKKGKKSKNCRGSKCVYGGDKSCRVGSQFEIGKGVKIIVVMGRLFIGALTFPKICRGQNEICRGSIFHDSL